MIEYITLSDLVKKVSQDAVEKGKEIFNTKKIREKYINIFEMMNIDRDKLKASDCKQSKDFKIPKDSQKFLIEVYWLYSDADMKKMRKGLFEQASLESIRCMIKRHHELYSYISEIRTCEINDAAEQKALNMTSEEEEYATVDFNYSIKLQEELDKNEEYKDLLLERKEILRSNGFINKLQPRFEAICERLQEIDNETQKKLWGEVVLKDSEDEDIDFSFRDTSENVFQEALKTYCDNNKSRREYEKRMGMITDEERLRVKEFIEQLEAQRKKPQ